MRLEFNERGRSESFALFFSVAVSGESVRADFGKSDTALLCILGSRDIDCFPRNLIASDPSSVQQNG